jgi:hypothetical protein
VSRDHLASFGVGLAALCSVTLLLHAAHVIAGHAWFSVYGPGVTLVLTGAILRSLGGVRGRDAIGLFAALVGVLVVPEWLEGELAAGHALTWATLDSHGASTLSVLGLAFALVVAWETARVLSLLRSR